MPVLLGTGFTAALFGLTTQIHNNTQVPTVAADIVSSPIVVAMLLALLLYARRARGSLRLENAFLVAVPVIAAFMAGAVFMQSGVTGVTDVAVKVLYSFSLALLYVALLEGPDTGSAVLPRTVAVSLLVVWGCTLVGSGLGLVLIVTTGLNPTTVTAVALGAMWLCTFVSAVLSRAFRPMAADADSGRPPEVVYIDRAEEQVRSFSRQVGLSEREQQIALLFVRGRSASRIASELTLSENTVKTHLQNIYGKAGLHSKQELLDRISEQDIQGPSDAIRAPEES